jgi:uncharacterized protein
VRRLVCVLASGLAVAACARDKDPYVVEVEAWRADRLERLKADDGWLTLAGLYWLKAGDNRIGTDNALEVALPAGTAPATVGVITLDERGVLSFAASPQAAVTLDGKPATRVTLVADDPGPPSTLKLGRLTFYVIKRQGRFAIRLKDNESLVRKQFAGINSYPIDRGFRVEARFERYDPPRTIVFPTALGGNDSATSPGAAMFTIGGHELRLEATSEPGADELSFVFGDLTSGHETYGGGRFLDTALPTDGSLILDFNKAYNPPCAFTPYATCPLPTRENKLGIRVEAGEQRSGSH